MLRAQRGDEMAFQELYRLVRAALYRYCLRMLGDRQLAEEAAQDVLVKVYRARARYQPHARFRTWMYRVATNHCLNERRRAFRAHEVSDGSGDPGQARAASVSSDPSAIAEGAQLAAALQHALDQLPPRQRAAVVLARFEGCTMAQIGAAMGITEGAAKALLNRALPVLSHALSPFLHPQCAEAT